MRYGAIIILLVLGGCTVFRPAEPDTDDPLGFYNNYRAAPGSDNVSAYDGKIRMIGVKPGAEFAGTLRAAVRTMQPLGGSHSDVDPFVSIFDGWWNGPLKALGHEKGANLIVYGKWRPGRAEQDVAAYDNDEKTYIVTFTDDKGMTHDRVVTVEQAEGGSPAPVVYAVLFRGDPEDVAALDPEAAAREPHNPERSVWGEAFNLPLDLPPWRVTAVYPRKQLPGYEVRSVNWPTSEPPGVFFSIGLDPGYPPDSKRALRELGRVYGATRVVRRLEFSWGEFLGQTALFYRHPVYAASP